MKINTPQELLKFMDDIEYAWMDKKGNFHTEIVPEMYTKYSLMSPEEVLKYKKGVCTDQSEFERDWFLKNEYEIKTIYEMVKLDYDNVYPSHSFLVYKDNDYWCWFENSDFNNRGIHKFNTLDELLNYQYKKYVEFLNTFNITNDELEKIIVTEYDKPEEHVTAEEYLNHVIDSKLLIIKKI